MMMTVGETLWGNSIEIDMLGKHNGIRHLGETLSNLPSPGKRNRIRDCGETPLVSHKSQSDQTFWGEGPGDPPCFFFGGAGNYRQTKYTKENTIHFLRARK